MVYCLSNNTVTQIPISLTTIGKEPKGLVLYAAAAPALAPTNPPVVVDNDKKDAMQVAFLMSHAAEADAAAAVAAVGAASSSVIVLMDNDRNKNALAREEEAKPVSIESSKGSQRFVVQKQLKM